MQFLRLVTASDLIDLADFAASPDNVRSTSAPPAASLEAGQGLLNAVAAELRSLFKLLMLAVDKELHIVGYVHTVIGQSRPRSDRFHPRPCAWGPAKPEPCRFARRTQPANERALGLSRGS